MKHVFAVALLTSVVAACGDSSPTAPTGPMASTSMTGTSTGSASDSSSAMGAGSLMGQAGMGTMTWPLTQSGSTVTGMARVDGTRTTMTGTFGGSNSCTGSFTNGQMTMTRR